MTLIPGTRFGPYEIQSLLGQVAWAKCIAPETQGYSVR
jgi:hypothetical protein